jgi:hypothetical protein
MHVLMKAAFCVLLFFTPTEALWELSKVSA